jgi:hypothetical protein
MISKSDAIREVLKEDLSQTAEQIKREVRRRYGLLVESNLICNVTGSHESRVGLTGYSDLLLDKAREFVETVGDDKLAISLLRVVAHE